LPRAKFSFLIPLGVASDLLGILLFVVSFLPQRTVVCLPNQIPGRLLEMRFCHYTADELQEYLKSWKHKEGELLRTLREKEEEFYQKSWELTEEARTTRKEVAIEEPRELTEIRYRIVEVQDTLRALNRTEMVARFWQAVRIPLRVAGIALMFFASLLLALAFYKRNS